MRMYRPVACLALAGLLVACGRSQPRSSGGTAGRGQGAAGFVGIEHPPEPPGVEDLGGWVIRTEAWRENRDTTTYAIQHAVIAGREWVWLDTLVRHTPDGRAIWRVVAALELPQAPANGGLVTTCERDDGSVEGQVFAIAEWAASNQKYLRVIHQAWRVDLGALAIAEVPPASVRCLNEAYGL